MRVLVCGSRHFNDAKLFHEVLDEIHKPRFFNPGEIKEIIHGDAKGADRLSDYYAATRVINVRKFPADWNKHGKAAGPIRNRQMLIEGKPDLVIAFLAPGSRGTKDMIEQAQKTGIPVKVVNI